ncbi:MAG TPA: 6-carboxytetrahydropterin synthase [Bryobacteraceae bacterium]|nr:6-carboxytetrahydropterin synthase [Bryobacteraceae bacterium]
MTFITRRYRFSASHRLHVEHLSDDENVRLYGKCNNPYGHGHDYVLAVTCAGPVDERTGQIVPPGRLDVLVEHTVLRLLASRNINLDVPQFAGLVPTTENLTSVIADLLQREWQRFIPAAVWLTRIHVQETDRNGFEVLVANASKTKTKVTADA